MFRKPINGGHHWRALLVLGLGIGSAHQTAAQEPMVLSKGLRELAAQVAVNISREQKHRVAVLPFQDVSGKTTAFGSFVGEELITHLFSREGIQIVERGMLHKILDEVELGGTGLIAPETAQKVGRIAGVDAIVTGSITDLQSFVAINARLIDTETGLLFAAAQVKIVRDDDVKKILAMKLDTGDSAELERPARKVQGGASEDHLPSQTLPIQQKEVRGLRFELVGCKFSGGVLACRLTVTSLQNDRIIHIRASVRCFDLSGNEYHASLVQFGKEVVDSSYSLISNNLISGVPIGLRVEFASIESPPSSLSALELVLVSASYDQPVTFRKIDVAQ